MLAFVTKSSKTRKEDIFSLPLFEIQKNVIAFLTQHVTPLYVYETFICMQAILLDCKTTHCLAPHNNVNEGGETTVCNHKARACDIP